MSEINIEEVIKYLYTPTDIKSIDDIGRIVIESNLSLMLKNAKLISDNYRDEKSKKASQEWKNMISERDQGKITYGEWCEFRKKRNATRWCNYEDIKDYETDHYFRLCSLSNIIKNKLTLLSRHNISIIINHDKILYEMFYGRILNESNIQFDLSLKCDDEKIENMLQRMFSIHILYMGYGHSVPFKYEIQGRYTEDEFYEHIKNELETSNTVFIYEQIGSINDGPFIVHDD